MSIATDIRDHLPHGVIEDIGFDKQADLHGQDAVMVKVILVTGDYIVGTFTTENKSGFGGVEFSQKKDVVKLMVSKIKAVLEGKADNG